MPALFCPGGSRGALVLSWLSFLLAGLFAGCGSSESSTRASDASAPPQARTQATVLAPTDSAVGVVQLYRGSPRSLPVYTLGSGETLTLAFDLLTDRTRPLSVSFAHANRTWRRDLSPSQYMASFSNDTIVDYRRSQGTGVPYVHYRYTFPNDDIRFRISGNYIVRVTEQGRPDAVLFERVFFIDETTGALDLRGESLVVTGQRQPSIRPVARFTPPDALRGDPFGYDVCFVRNGRWNGARCSSRPLLAERPALLFELDRRDAFAPRALSYALDLSALRPGGEIERIDRSTVPYCVLLQPDAAQFPDTDVLQNSQLGGPEVEAAGRLEPDITAEYVRTTFAFVPPNEQPLTRAPVLRGTFTDPPPARGPSLRWVARRQRYEGAVLLKQGRYRYEYELRAADRASLRRQAAPVTSDVYTTFVYYRDPSRNTDRLLSVGAFRP